MSTNRQKYGALERKYKILEYEHININKIKKIYYIKYDNKYFSFREMAKIKGCNVTASILEKRIRKIRNKEGSIFTLKDAIFNDAVERTTKKVIEEARAATKRRESEKDYYYFLYVLSLFRKPI